MLFFHMESLEHHVFQCNSPSYLGLSLISPPLHALCANRILDRSRGRTCIYGLRYDFHATWDRHIDNSAVIRLALTTTWRTLLLVLIVAALVLQLPPNENGMDWEG